MLSNKEILRCLREKTIEVTCACAKTSAGTFDYVEPAAFLGADSDWAKSRIGRNRMALSLGPLVMVLNSTKISAENRFQGFGHVWDLRKKAFTITPGQSVVVFTNEWIRLNETVAGLILPRVNSYPEGISVETSYVDSGWMGILLLRITNEGPYARDLVLGEEIARVFFFRLGEPSNQDIKTHRPKHFAKTWEAVMHDTSDPFQMPTSDRRSSAWERLVHLDNVSSKWLGMGLLLVLGTGVFYGVKGVIAVNEFLNDKAKLEATLVDIEASRSRTPVSGETIVEIRKDETSGSKPVQLPRELIIKGGFQFVEVVSGPRPAKALGNLDSSDGIWRLVIRVEAPSPAAQSESYKIKYAVIP